MIHETIWLLVLSHTPSGALEWGSNQQSALVALQRATQATVPIWVTGLSNLSVHQLEPIAKTPTQTRVPTELLNHNLLESGKKYAAFERQLLACHCDSVNTETRTQGCKIILRLRNLIVMGVWTKVSDYWVEAAQESSTINKNGTRVAGKTCPGWAPMTP